MSQQLHKSPICWDEPLQHDGRSPTVQGKGESTSKLHHICASHCTLSSPQMSQPMTEEKLLIKQKIISRYEFHACKPCHSCRAHRYETFADQGFGSRFLEGLFLLLLLLPVLEDFMSNPPSSTTDEARILLSSLQSSSRINHIVCAAPDENGPIGWSKPCWTWRCC